MGRTAATQRGLSGSGYRFRVYPDGMSLGYVFVLFFCGAPFCTCFCDACGLGFRAYPKP